MKNRDLRPGAAGGCEEVQALLPWHANGTLPPDEQAAVEAHLMGCAACRVEARECGELARTVRDAEPLAPTPHPVQLARLMARVEAAERRRPGSDLAFGRRLRRWAARLWAGPTALRWAVLVQAALLVGLTAALIRVEPRPPAAYRTLSDTDRPSPAMRLRVLFAEDATELEIRRLLLPLGAEIAAGPSPLGAYTVVVPAGGQRADPASVVAAHLRSQPKVRFAEALEER
jgi:hypothetical protein